MPKASSVSDDGSGTWAACTSNAASPNLVQNWKLLLLVMRIRTKAADVGLNVKTSGNGKAGPSVGVGVEGAEQGRAAEQGYHGERGGLGRGVLSAAPSTLDGRIS